MKPRFITIHCSDSPDDRDIGKKEINEWHVERGFKKIGYHFVVRRDGTIEEGRDISEQGAHVHGYNTDNVGVVLVGRYEFTKGQLATLWDLVLDLMKHYRIPLENVKGHYEWPKVQKTCPNLDMVEMRRMWS